MSGPRNWVVAFGGPPHSGKSVLLAELYRQLLQRRPAGFVFLQRCCPDGEGMWSSETDPDLVREIRRKGGFDQKFMLFTLKSIEQLSQVFPLVLVDLGGKRSAETAECLARSTHLVVLSSQEEEVTPWVEYGKAEDCEILATLQSRLGSGESSLDLSQTPLQGELVGLERESSADQYKKSVAQLAEWLIEKIESR